MESEPKRVSTQRCDLVGVRSHHVVPDTNRRACRLRSLDSTPRDATLRGSSSITRLRVTSSTLLQVSSPADPHPYAEQTIRRPALRLEIFPGKGV